MTLSEMSWKAGNILTITEQQVGVRVHVVAGCQTLSSYMRSQSISLGKFSFFTFESKLNKPEQHKVLIK